MQVIPKTQAILSICIPTYNNHKRLGDLLDFLSNQDLDGIELLIRDDSPSSDTEEVVEKYKYLLTIEYFHGAKEGYDAAILFLADKAQGKFIWWFGDDLMQDGTIAKVKELITKYPDLSFIRLNSISKFDLASFASHKYKDKDKFFKDRNEIIRNEIGLLASGSSTIIKKESINPFLPGAFKYKGSSLMTFYLTLGAISSGGRYYFVSYPYIVCEPKPPGESRWYDSFQVHGINIFVIAQDFKDKFDRESLRKGLAEQFGYIWRAVVLERALGFETGFAAPSPKIMKMAKLYWGYLEFYVALPLMLLPRPILRILHVLYKGIRELRGEKRPVTECVRDMSAICPYDGAPLFCHNEMLYRCPACHNDYPVEGGVLRLLDKENSFYEDSYGGQMRFLPRSERPWHIWPVWLINSGYPWMVRRHVPEGGVVLELGCAGGVRYFGKRYRMIGCDLSFTSLKKLVGIYDHLIQADACIRVPLPNNSVDAIVSSFFWEHIPLASKKIILSELYRILRPGGKIIFLYDVETRNPLINHYKQKNPLLYNRLFLEKDGHFGYQRPVDNLTLFQDAGFKMLEHQGMEKTWFQYASTYSKLVEFGETSRRLFFWTRIFDRRPWFYLYTVFMRLIDNLICVWLPKDWARIDLVVAEKKST